jgi:hypothetical protein
MEQHTQFMLIFRFEPNFNYQPSEAELAQMHEQWGAYFAEITAQQKFVNTHQLGFTGVQVHADGTATQGIYITDKLTLGGNLVINANNIDEAVSIAKQCPILLMGGTVEVRDIQPM